MLSELERKITAVVGDSLSGRPHLSVLEAPAPPPDLQPGKGSARVSLSGLTPQSSFEPGMFVVDGDAGARKARRVLGLKFGARVEFLLRPADQAGAALAAARKLLLDDVALVAHALGAPPAQSGAAFKSGAADPGFSVRTFALVNGSVGGEPQNQLLAGELLYEGDAYIWPPGGAEDAGEIQALDVMLAPLPLNVSVAKPQLKTGGQTDVRIAPVRGGRLSDGGARAPLQLAVGVVSDLPPAQRGQIVTGQASATAGFRVVTAGEGETSVVYRAPAGDLGATRLEYVAVHLATPQREVGIFLGSAAVRLAP
jgi:hypothetical protein